MPETTVSAVLAEQALGLSPNPWILAQWIKRELDAADARRLEFSNQILRARRLQRPTADRQPLIWSFFLYAHR